jgi:hypothetical protein
MPLIQNHFISFCEEKKKKKSGKKVTKVLEILRNSNFLLQIAILQSMLPQQQE